IGGVFEHYLYPVPCLDLVVLLYGDPIDLDVPTFGGLLYLVTGGVLDKVHQVFVHPQGFLPLGPNKAIVLKEFLFLGKVLALLILGPFHLSWIQPVSWHSREWSRCHRSVPPWRSWAICPPVLHTCR